MRGVSGGGSAGATRATATLKSNSRRLEGTCSIAAAPGRSTFGEITCSTSRLCFFSPDDANDHSGDAAVDAEGAHDVVIQ